MEAQELCLFSDGKHFFASPPTPSSLFGPSKSNKLERDVVGEKDKILISVINIQHAVFYVNMIL